MFNIGKVVFEKKGKKSSENIDLYLPEKEYNLLKKIAEMFQIEDIKQLVEIRLEDYYQKLKESEDIKALPRLIATLIEKEITEMVIAGDNGQIVIRDIDRQKLIRRINDAIEELSNSTESATTEHPTDVIRRIDGAIGELSNRTENTITEHPTDDDGR